MALDQTRFRQKPQVTRDARLRLGEDGGQILDRQLGLAEERQDAQARCLARGLQSRDQRVHRERRSGVHDLSSDGR